MEEPRGVQRHTRERPEGGVPLSEALRYWLRLGFVNFGGPAGQIALMHEDLVERKRWIGEGRFLHALNFCMLLPGPEAQQLAIYVGWLLNGTLGGIVAGVLFVLPAFFLILLLSWAYVVHGEVAWVAAIFYGLQAAVVALVVAAVLRIGRRALKNPVLLVIAVAAFLAIFAARVPFPLIVVGAAALGLAGSRWKADLFPSPVHDEPGDSVLGDAPGKDRRRRPLVVLVVGLLVWWGPLLLVILLRGVDDTLSRQAVFFSQAAMVTFGGAYAVLAYVNQAAVEQFGWLEPGQMVAGLGLAESTPGPLIMVAQFVGFLGAYRLPGGLDPLVAGTLGALVTAWATFAPCFLWIFLGAPYIERLRGNRALSAALSAVTAAVVGVILNLAVTFATAASFGASSIVGFMWFRFRVPSLPSVDVFLAVATVAGFVALWRYRLNVLWVVGGSAAAGLVYRLT